MNQSVSRRGNSQDNAPMESLFGRMKCVILDIVALCKSYGFAKTLVDNYLYAFKTSGQRGSLNALTPVGFAQRNRGNHYIYAIAWLRYKDKSGNIHTIYTDALPTTLQGVSSAGSVSKTGE